AGEGCINPVRPAPANRCSLHQGVAKEAIPPRWMAGTAVAWRSKTSVLSQKFPSSPLPLPLPLPIPVTLGSGSGSGSGQRRTGTPESNRSPRIHAMSAFDTTLLPEHARVIANPDVWMEGDGIAQFAKTARLPGCVRAVAMPDLHLGKGPVGAVFATD